MACVAVISLMRTIELEFLQTQPRPILQQKELIPCNKVLIRSLHEKLGFLIELFDENRMDGIQAIKELETNLRDVAFRVEYEIEFQIAELYEDEYEDEEEEIGIADLLVKAGEALDLGDIEAVDEEFGVADLLVEAEETLGLGDIEAEDEEFGVADLYVENPQGERSWPSCKLRHILEKAIEDIDAIKEELAKVKHVIALQRRETALDAFTECDEEVIMLGNSSQHASHSEEIMVGKNNEFQIVKKMLIEHSSRQREIVSIIGMGGIGKTTLAKSVYFVGLLRVLYNIECNIGNLVHLRYLFSNGSHNNMLKPFRAWNLQILSSRMGFAVLNILEFPQLQHLNCLCIPSDLPIFFHKNLKSISWIRHDVCTRELFANIPHVKKVKVMCYSGASNDFIKNLAYLHQLESLYLFSNYYPPRYQYVVNPNNHIGRLENLKKLAFNGLMFGWKTVNILSKLPKLEVLKLLKCFCIGEEVWKLSKKEKFEQLVCLIIDEVDLKCWEASAYHFPKLECLILSCCFKLEEIPANFAEISNLKSIKLIRCLPSAVASAKQIWEEQHEQGNDDMIVIEEDTEQPLSF